MLKFLKNALFRGLIVLIPVVLIYITIRELLELVIGFAEPIADLFPVGTFETENGTELLAAAIVGLTALSIGMLASVPLFQRAGSWIEQRTLGILPLYQMIKSLVSAFLEVENASSFRPAMLQVGDGSLEPAYIIEDHGGPHLVVLLPWSPTSFAGTVKLVPREAVQRIDTTLDEFSLSLSNFGLGLQDLITPHNDPASVPADEK